MNPLRRVLLSLKSPPSTSWNVVITPDPRRYHGLEVLNSSTFPIAASLPYVRLRQRIGSASGVYEFRMRLDSDMDMPRYLSENPTFGFASNSYARARTIKLSLRPRPIQTEWIRIIAKDKESSPGPIVREALVEILDRFPRYELLSEEGIGVAIDEIEGRLSAVALFEDMDATSRDERLSGSSPPGNEHDS